MSQQTKIYDFVIIGSGIGGLTCGALLSKKGFSVLILEKNNQIGGCLQIFSRDKNIFDTGVHYIGGLQPGGNLNRFFNYLGILKDLKIHPLNEDGFDVMYFQDGSTYAFGQGYDRFKSQLKKDFPNESQAIDIFCDQIKNVCTYFPLYELKTTSEFNYNNQPDILTLNTKSFLEEITKDERLIAVLGGTGLLYGLDEETPFYVLALIMNSFILGSYRISDGGSHIAKAMVKVIKSQGGEVLKRKEMTHAEVDENRSVQRVFMKDGTSYSGKHFISNLHPNDTIRLFGTQHFLNAYKNRISKLENTPSSFVVYLSLKPNKIKYFNHNYYWHRSNQVFSFIKNKETWPNVLFIACGHHSKNEDYTTSMSITTYMDFQEVEEWSTSYNTVFEKNTRNQAYEAFKRLKEKQILEVLTQVFPDIHEAIEAVYSSTPLTYRDYLGNKDGNLYGIAKKSSLPLETNIQARTKLPNLFLTGQNTVFHGILGATISGFVTAFHFIDREEVINEINDMP